MDIVNIFAVKLEMISNLLELQTDDEQDDDACKQFCLQFIQALEELNSSSGVTCSVLTECSNQAVQHLALACRSVPFISPEFSKACHTFLKLCLSLVISQKWKDADGTCQQTLCTSLLAAHQYLVPWVGHGFFLAACLAMEPWSHPTLRKILLGQSVSQEEVHAYLSYEGHYLCEQRIKILLEEDYATHALNLSLYCAHDKEMKKNPIYLETLLMLQDDLGEAAEMWNEIQWHHCSQDVVPIIESLLPYAASTAAKVSSMLLVKEWQMETTSLQDMRHITELWVQANWNDCLNNLPMFEERVQETVKGTHDPVYRMYLADSLYLYVENEDIAKLCVTLCLSAIRQSPTNPEISYLAASTVDLNNAALCHVIAKIVSNDYALYRLCLLTAFCITPSQESFNVVEEAYTTTPAVSSEANPSNLPAHVHCGTVQCMNELLPRRFTPKYRPCDWFTSSKSDWAVTNKMCEQVLKNTKFVSSKWTLTNGEVVTIKTYVKNEIDQSDSSDEDDTSEEDSEEYSHEIFSIFDDELKSDDSDSDSDTGDNSDTDSEMSLTAKEKTTPRKKLENGAYNLRPSRKRVAVYGTDEYSTDDESDVSSSWDDDDRQSENPTSEASSGKSKVQGHYINGSKGHGVNGSKGQGVSPGKKRKGNNSSDEKLQNLSIDEEIRLIKKKKGRPRKIEKRGRGRPRKYPLVSDIPNKKLCTEQSVSEDSDSDTVDQPLLCAITGKFETNSPSIEEVKPNSKVMKLTLNSDVKSTEHTKSNNHTVCEGPKTSDPNVLLKSKKTDESVLKVKQENTHAVLHEQSLTKSVTKVKQENSHAVLHEQQSLTKSVVKGTENVDNKTISNSEDDDVIFIGESTASNSERNQSSNNYSLYKSSRGRSSTSSSVNQTVFSPAVNGTSRKNTETIPKITEMDRKNTEKVPADTTTVSKSTCAWTKSQSTLSGARTTDKVPFCGDNTKITSTISSIENKQKNVCNRSNVVEVRIPSRANAKHPPFPVFSRSKVPRSETNAPHTETNAPHTETNAPSKGVNRTLSCTETSESDMHMAAVETLLALSSAKKKIQTKSMTRNLTTKSKPVVKLDREVSKSKSLDLSAASTSQTSQSSTYQSSQLSTAPTYQTTRPSTAPTYHKSQSSTGPTYHTSRLSTAPTYQTTESCTASTYYKSQSSTGHTYHTSQLSTAPTFQTTRLSTMPTYHKSQSFAAPTYQTTESSTAPTYHKSQSSAASTYQASQSSATPTYETSQPTSASFVNCTSSASLYDSHSGISSSSTTYNTITSTNNTHTCSNVNVLKSPKRNSEHVYLATTQNLSSHVSTSPQRTANSSNLPQQNVQLIWTANDNNTVTVEYNGKTFKVPVTSVPETLSRNLLGQQQGNVVTSSVTASPARVISIQAPLTATPNLNLQTMAVQNPVVINPNPSPQMITVQAPLIAAPNRATIQVIPNVPNPQVIAYPVQTAHHQVLSTSQIPRSNPMQVITLPYTSRHNTQPLSIPNTSNANSVKFVSTTPCANIGYIQNVRTHYDYGGAITSISNNPNMKVVGIPTATTAGSPQRATQHIRIAYSPQRPFTRSQVQPTRPVTRAYARDSPRFSPWSSSQTRGKTYHQPVKRSNIKSVGGSVSSKQYKTLAPDSTHQTKQIPMRSLDFTGTSSRRIPDNKPRKLEILPCSPPSTHKPKPHQPLSETVKQLKERLSVTPQRVSTAPPQVPKPQRMVLPSQQVLQQHQQVHTQQLQQHQQQFQALQQKPSALVLVPNVQPALSVSCMNTTTSQSFNTNIQHQTVQGSEMPIQPSMSTTTNNIPIQSIAQSSSVTLPTSVPFYLTPATTSASSGLTQLILATPPASSAASSFTSPFKNIKQYPGKVRKGRLESR